MLCVIDIYSKHEWFVPLKDRKGVTITNAFKKILDGPGLKSNKMWVDKGSEFYHRPIKSWVEDNGIEIHSGKSVVT